MDPDALTELLTDIFDPSDFMVPASVDPGEAYTNAVVLLLIKGGPELVSMGSVARQRGQVPSAVKQRIGGKDAFLQVVMERFATRWLLWVSRPPREGAAKSRLPRAIDEVHGVRVWRVLREIAAGEARAGRAGLAERVAEITAWERADLARHLEQSAGRSPTSAELAALHALAVGLREAMSDPVDPLTFGSASEALELVTRSLGLAPAASRAESD